MAKYNEEPYEYPDKVVCVSEFPSGKALKMTPVEANTTEPIIVPKSAIHDDSEVREVGQEGKLVVKMWLAEDRGWE